jgi:hypothetical protein
MRGVWFCVVLAGLAGMATAADINVSGMWLRTADRNDLSAGAGSDLVPQIDSPDGAATLSITGTTGAWRVEVERATTGSWPEGMQLAVSANGGNSFVILTQTPQTLFEGTGDQLNVPIQFRVQGASVHTRAGAYSLLVIYRVIPL